MSGVRTSSLSLPSSLRNWVILDYEEANGLTIRPWAPVFSCQLFSLLIIHTRRRPARSPHFTRRGETGSAGYGKWSESWTERKERQTRNRRSEVNGRRGYEPTWTERVIRSERVTWGGETRDVRNERRTACLTSLSIPSRRSPVRHVPVTSLRVANRPPAGMVIRRE